MASKAHVGEQDRTLTPLAAAPVAAPNTLKGQAVRGVRWTLYGTLLNLALQTLLLALVARWLDRAELGLAAIAMALTQLAVLIADGGLGSAVYRRGTLSPGEPLALMWTGIGLSLVLGLALAALAPLVALLYRQPELEALVRLFAISVVCLGPGLMHRTLLQRNLRFKTLAAVDVFAAAFATLTSLSLLVAGFGLTSLACGAVMRSVASSVGWHLSGRDLVPSVAADWSHVRLYLRLGSIQLLSSLLAFFGGQADVFLTGTLLGMVPLAVFDTAKGLMFRPTQLTVPVVQRVFAPTLAQVSESQERLRGVFGRMLTLTIATNLPLFCGLALAARPLVSILLGDRWADTVSIVPLLAPFAVATLLVSACGQLLYALGKATELLRWNLFRAITNLTAVAVGAQWGPTGIAIGITLQCYLQLALMFVIDVRPITGATLRELTLPMVPYVAAAAIAAVPALLIVWLVPIAWLALGLATLAYAGTYATYLWFTHPEARELWQLIRSQGLLS